MYRVTREIPFCYGHRLLNYQGKCRNLHGHNGRAVITIESEELDELGMVMDFSDIKKVVSAWIDEKARHPSSPVRRPTSAPSGFALRGTSVVAMILAQSCDGHSWPVSGRPQRGFASCSI